MELRRIYALAAYKAVEVWAHEHDFLKAHPTDELAQIREQKAWAELTEIERLLKAEEEKEEK